MSAHTESVEDRFIRAFKKTVDAAGVRPRGLVAGMGDDAAILRGHGEDLVITNDVLVEGRHFERSWQSGTSLGWRAAAVNLSDIAAMGACPRYALVSLLVPDTVKHSYVKSIERGVVDHFALYGAAVIGGNVSSTTGPLVIDITAVGACPSGGAWRRAARAGDAIVVAGRIGDAAMGLELLRDSASARGTLVKAFRKPVPRIDVAELLAIESAVHSAIDISDGFSTDLIRMCRAGDVGCRIEAVALPVSRALRTCSIVRGEDAIDRAMGGGEDYALILGIARTRAVAICARIHDTLSIPASVVGEFTSKKGSYRIERDGRRRSFRATGWDHFRGHK